MPVERGNNLVHFCQAWERQDLAKAMEAFHDNVVYAMVIPQEVVPFGGESHGKAAMADRMRMILGQFEMLRFELIDDRGEAGVEHARVAYAFRHRVTSETISGTMRQVARVEDNLIVDLKEFYDVEKIRAFMRLIAYKAVENPAVDC